ncbi:MAG TPA: DUF642 domain-containing protein, partial [Chthoniobacterales bacterium]
MLATADVDAATNLIVDGDFETPPAAGNNVGQTQGYYTYGFTTITSTVVPVTGVAPANQWTIGRAGTPGGAGGTNAPRFHWFSKTSKQAYDPSPASGSTYAVQLNTDRAAATTQIYMAQTVTVVAGQRYALTYQYTGEISTNQGKTGGLQVRVSGDATASVDNTFTSSTTYTNGAVSFIAAASGPALVYFADNAPAANPNQNVVLDNISLTAVTP